LYCSVPDRARELAKPWQTLRTNRGDTFLLCQYYHQRTGVSRLTQSPSEDTGPYQQCHCILRIVRVGKRLLPCHCYEDGSFIALIRSLQGHSDLECLVPVRPININCHPDRSEGSNELGIRIALMKADFRFLAAIGMTRSGWDVWNDMGAAFRNDAIRAQGNDKRCLALPVPQQAV